MALRMNRRPYLRLEQPVLLVRKEYLQGVWIGRSTKTEELGDVEDDGLHLLSQTPTRGGVLLKNREHSLPEGVWKRRLGLLKLLK